MSIFKNIFLKTIPDINLFPLSLLVLLDERRLERTKRIWWKENPEVKVNLSILTKVVQSLIPPDVSTARALCRSLRMEHMRDVYHHFDR